MSPETVEALFTRGDGRYAFARWGRPIVPVVFGVTEESLGVFKGACEAVVAMAGHKMARLVSLPRSKMIVSKASKSGGRATAMVKILDRLPISRPWRSIQPVSTSNSISSSQAGTEISAI